MTMFLRAVAIALVIIVAGFLFGVVSMNTLLIVAFLAVAVTPGLFILSSAGQTVQRRGARRTSHGW